MEVSGENVVIGREGGGVQDYLCFWFGRGAYYLELGEEEMLVLEKEFSDGYVEFEVFGVYLDKMFRSWTDV